MRYVVGGLIAVGLLFWALRAGAQDDSAPGPNEAAEIVRVPPQVRAQPRADGGVDVQVVHRLQGSASRARLEYKTPDGTTETVDATDCRSSLGGKVRKDETGTEIELGGAVPKNAKDLRLVLEDETGTRVVPVPLP